MATARPDVHSVAMGGSISGIGPHRLDYRSWGVLEQGTGVSPVDPFAKVLFFATSAQMR
jgi:hypothetical protein